MSSDLREYSLVRSLQEILREPGKDMSSFHEAAKIVASRPAEVIHLLTSCLALPAQWRDISASAYLHSNGFAKFVIYDAEATLFKLRLHVWTGGHDQVLKQEDQNVHGHRWNFGSAVIAGPGLQVDEYVQSDVGIPYQSYEYRSRRGENVGSEDLPASVSELEPVGEVQLERSVSYAPSTFDTYVCDITRLHTVRSATCEVTATLIVQGPSVLSSAPVFRRFDQQPQLPARAMSDGQARRVFAAAIDAAQRSEAGHDQAS